MDDISSVIVILFQRMWTYYAYVYSALILLVSGENLNISRSIISRTVIHIAEE